MTTYQVTVSGIGTVYDGINAEHAREAFEHYRALSIAGAGREGNRDVYLSENGIAVRSYLAPAQRIF